MKKKKKVKNNWQEKRVDFSLHVFEVFEFSSYYYLKKKKKSSRILAVHTAGAKQLS